MNGLSNVKLPFKFLLLGILVCVSIVIPTKFFYETEMTLMDTSKQELDGIVPSTRLNFLIQKVQDYRALTALYLNQQDVDAKALSAKGAEVSEDFNQVAQLLKNNFPSSDMLAHVDRAKTEFTDLRPNIEAMTILPSDAFAKLTVVLAELRTKVIPSILKESGLSYDPVASSYHLIIAINQNLPLLIEGLTRLRDQGSIVLAREGADSKQLASIKSLESFIAQPQQDLIYNLQSADKSGDNQEVKALLSKISSLENSVSDLLLLVDREILSKNVTSYDPNAFFDESSSVINNFYAAGQSGNQIFSTMMRERIESANQTVLTNFSFLGGLILLLIIISIVVIRSLNNALNAVSQATTRVSHGDFSIQLNTSRKDEFGAINHGLINMAKSLAVAQEEREKTRKDIEAKLVETTRIEEALSATTTNVMIANNDRNIIYANRSIQTMLSNVEAELRKVIPHFSANKIVGSNMDIFHKGDSQGREQESVKGTSENQIQVGTLYFRVVENPIYSQSGERIGAIIELLDRTSEIEAENEIANIVKQASKGNFSMRVKMEKKEGFMKFISESLNQLVETADYGLTDIGRVLMSLSQGNLTERIVADYDGQFDYLKRYCNETSENLANMIGEIRNAAETISLASTEIAQGNVDLSNRTENQASSLEETASSMEEITSTVRLNADNANQANLLASEASEVATEGGRLIASVVETMASINQSSQRIADIIGVIDGIAFQTNILALNAAVEAARAGEQGRGFAVVASEVRTLAQRSANAAKDIKSLISDSVSKIEDGNKLVGQSGQTMDRIVESINRVNGIMSDIASASAEQAAGIDEINKAISLMDEMTQQNAALVEESAASAESMQDQASQLEERVSTFILSKTDSVLDKKVALPTPTSLNKPINKALEVKSSQEKSPQNKASQTSTTQPKSTPIKATESKHASTTVSSETSAVPKTTKAVKKAVINPPVLDDDDWEEF